MQNGLKNKCQNIKIQCPTNCEIKSHQIARYSTAALPWVILNKPKKLWDCEMKTSQIKVISGELCSVEISTTSKSVMK